MNLGQRKIPLGRAGVRSVFGDLAFRDCPSAGFYRANYRRKRRRFERSAFTESFRVEQKANRKNNFLRACGFLRDLDL